MKDRKTMIHPSRGLRSIAVKVLIIPAIIVNPTLIHAKLPDRSRIVELRKDQSTAAQKMNSRVYDTYTKPQRELPIEGPKYRGKHRWEAVGSNERRKRERNLRSQSLESEFDTSNDNGRFERELGSQLSGCCSTYSSYSADLMCYKYGENCETGAEPSHDSGDGDCSMEGLSFIGVSFSVNTANGNPYSYQLCDQYPMENIIDRDYDYVMSMDEDGWLVGGGYKSFDFSGKMPYIDSSHTELLRIGSLDPEYG